MVCGSARPPRMLGSAPGQRTALFVELSEDPLDGEEFGSLHESRRRVVAAPRPLLGTAAKSCADRIQDHVTRNLEKVRFLLDQDGLVAVLEHATKMAVARIELARIQRWSRWRPDARFGSGVSTEGGSDSPSGSRRDSASRARVHLGVDLEEELAVQRPRKIAARALPRAVTW